MMFFVGLGSSGFWFLGREVMFLKVGFYFLGVTEISKFSFFAPSFQYSGRCNSF